MAMKKNKPWSYKDNFCWNEEQLQVAQAATSAAAFVDNKVNDVQKKVSDIETKLQFMTDQMGRMHIEPNKSSIGNIENEMKTDSYELKQPEYETNHTIPIIRTSNSNKRPQPPIQSNIITVTAPQEGHTNVTYDNDNDTNSSNLLNTNYFTENQSPNTFLQSNPNPAPINPSHYNNESGDNQRTQFSHSAPNPDTLTTFERQLLTAFTANANTPTINLCHNGNQFTAPIMRYNAQPIQQQQRQQQQQQQQRRQQQQQRRQQPQYHQPYQQPQPQPYQQPQPQPYQQPPSIYDALPPNHPLLKKPFEERHRYVLCRCGNIYCAMSKDLRVNKGYHASHIKYNQNEFHCDGENTQVKYCYESNNQLKTTTFILYSFVDYHSPDLEETMQRYGKLRVNRNEI